jgi:crotonobetainyl-CoA:carnitine CoA-transferase CaiB-like acyl-CoA transferase
MNANEQEDLLPGLKVLEVATYAAGPTIGAILADFGADVIHLEEREHGDPYRTIVSQAWLSSEIDASFNASWELVNRNKRSVGVNLKTESGQLVLAALVRQADVFVTNYLGNTRRDLAVEYSTIAAINPSIIYVGLTGYGDRGPWSERRGYDFSAYWAGSGMMGMFAEAVGTAFVSRPGMGDRPTGLVAAGAVGLALYNRERTGKGQEISLDLMHSGLWTVGADVQRVAALGAPLPYESRDQPSNPLWNPYPTADGKWIMLAMHPSFDFKKVCQALGRPDIGEDPRFETAKLRETHSAELVSILDGIIRTRSRDEWDAIFEKGDLIWAPVLMPEDIMTSEQAQENGVFFKAEHPAVGTYPLLRSPINFSRTPARFRRRAPNLGEHTAEILAEAGFTPEQVDSYMATGEIRTA